MDEGTIYGQIDYAKPPLEYDRFRTGLTYADVYYLIYNRPHKRRNGVLGAWREIKLKMYDRYLFLYENREYGETSWFDVCEIMESPIPD